MSTSHDLPYYNAFNTIPQIGSVRLRKLLNFFPDLETAWRAPAAELEQTGLEPSVIEKIAEARGVLNVEQEFMRLEKLGVTLLTWDDPRYPSHLKQITNLPAVLYVRGRLLPEDDTAVAVVGTRKHSVYGKQETN